MSKLRISDAPLLPDVNGSEKIPTGGRGDLAISMEQVKTFSQGGLPQQINAHVNNTENPHNVTKVQVGLGEVNNTSDVDKPISTATQEALDLKANTVDVYNSLNLKADKTYVDTQDNLKLDKSEKGASGGLATLDSSGKVPRDELPPFVDLTSTVPTFNNLEAGVDPMTGVTDGAYFNVRSEDDETVAVEYRNVGGSAVATGKSYLSAVGVEQQEKPASTIKDASGRTQQEINNNVVDPELGKPTTAKTFVLNPLNRMMGRALEEKLNGEFASVKDGGAIGDGTLHTLQEWVDSGKFSGLAAIKLAYPTATALTDSIDAVVIQTWVDNYRRVLTPDGIYLINKSIVIEGSGCELYGESVSTYGAGETVKTRFVHAFNGDMITLNTTTATTPRGRHRIRGIAFASDDNFSGRAVVLRSSQNHLVDLSFYKFKDGGIRIQGRSYGTYIIKPSFDQCGSNGAYDISGDIDTGGTSAADYNTLTVVADGIFETSKTGAISLKDSDPFYLYRNYIEPFGSTSNKPMVEIKNSPSGNTRGWITENYMGSINGNDFAIHATGVNLFANDNRIVDFKSGIYLSSQTGSVNGNDIQGYISIGIQLASNAAGVNNNATAISNRMRSKSTGAVHGIIASSGVNGGLICDNMVRGKHDYYVRLLSAHNFLVESNNLLPLYGAAISGSGIYEDDGCTGNVVKANNAQATTKYRRYSFEYDDFYLPSTSLPTTGVWKKGDVVKVPDPVSFGAIGYICTTAGTGAEAVWQKYGLIIKQIPARPNVVASDLAALVAAHNALLADLRSANIMAT